MIKPLLILCPRHSAQLWIPEKIGVMYPLLILSPLPETSENARVRWPFRPLVSPGRAPGIFFDPCPTGDLLGGALSVVRAQCNYLDV